MDIPEFRSAYRVVSCKTLNFATTDAEEPSVIDGILVLVEAKILYRCV